MTPALRRGTRALAAIAAIAVLAPAQVHAQAIRYEGGPAMPAPTVTHDELPRAAPAAFAHGAGAHAGAAATATFVVTYSGFPDDARAAFQAAADRWAEFVSSPVPIRVDARWVPLGSNVLGSAGPFLVRDFSGAPLAGTWYPDALANAIAGRDLDPGAFDIRATFNSTFDRWHVDPTTAPPGNAYDLATVVLHELGHGLGFIGSMDVEGGQGVFGGEDPGSGAEDGIPFVFDRRTQDGTGRPLLEYGSPSATLASVLQESVYFDGPATRGALGDRAELYAPSVWAPGSSYSHLDESAFPQGAGSALMTPFFAQGERITAPDVPACAMLVDIGWAPGAGCAALLPGVEPPVDEVALALAPGAPNPSRGGTRLILTVGRTQRVRAGVYDAAGRHVARLFDADVVEGEPVVLHVPAAEASGVYFVRVDGDGFTESETVTLLR